MVQKNCYGELCEQQDCKYHTNQFNEDVTDEQKDHLQKYHTTLYLSTYGPNALKQTSKLVILCDKKSIQECPHLSRLVNVFVIYNKCNSEEQKMTDLSINILETLNDYIHILQQHDSDQEFEFITHKLSTCDMKTCVALRRNYRDRSKPDSNVKLNANQQILDKIHCYFTHSFDIGNRLTINEKRICYGDIKVANDELIEDIFIDKLFLNMKQIVSIKMNLCKAEVPLINLRVSKKCDQLVSIKNEQKMFHFGYKFMYGFVGEGNDDDVSVIQSNARVKPKHRSIKEELLCNDISILNLDQFMNEYQKAAIHLNSGYCKRSFASYEQFGGQLNEDYIATWVFSIEYVLSLMVYCNYTDLQYHFSKTFREKVNDVWEADHEQFYHLGKNLLISVQKFGKLAEKTETFYHGISEMLQFPYYLNHWHRSDLGNKPDLVNIFCPLSTTSSFPVAFNFANNNQGMVVTFGCYDAKYFSVECLSDYPSEKEYLFLKNDEGNVFSIRNILEVKTGCEYALILNALRFMQLMTNFNNENPQKLPDIKPVMQQLIIKIIHHRLSFTNDKYTAFESLTEYGKKMIESFFENEMYKVEIDYASLKDKNYNLILNELFHVKYEWLNMQCVTALFKNLKRITIINVNLCAWTMDNIVFHLCNNRYISKLNWLKICPKYNSVLHISRAVSKYKQKFQTIKFDITKKKETQGFYSLLVTPLRRQYTV
eukprot:449795_1